MDWLVYVALPGVFVLGGLSAGLVRRKVADPATRARLAKLAVGCFGSAGIVWIVFLLADLLQLLVILVAIGYLARRLTAAGPLHLPKLPLLRKHVR